MLLTIASNTGSKNNQIEGNLTLAAINSNVNDLSIKTETSILKMNLI